MKKRLLALLLAAAMVFSLAACGNKEEGNTNNDTNETVELEDTLVIYTTHAEDMVGVIADAFTKETGVAVEFINL